MPYERAEELIRDEDVFAVAPCICRQEKDLMGHGCGKPSETCLSIGGVANYYLHNGLGRKIDKEDALQLLRQANEAGLVLQPANAKKPVFICACCGCCCGVLKNMKRHPQPASVVSTPFRAVLESELCNDCGVCETRCQMDAISLESGYTELNHGRCIGCGLCVSTCSMGALSLERKPDVEQPHVPRDLTDTNIKIGQARGVLSAGDLAGMLVKSKVDRLLAKRN
ncbi:MAG TPA: 4Fe-4S binding protein [Anaerolineales bacterium]|nr:4Fe-4S binding protein [Anaerolineales bacterium]